MSIEPASDHLRDFDIEAADFRRIGRVRLYEGRSAFGVASPSEWSMRGRAFVARRCRTRAKQDDCKCECSQTESTGSELRAESITAGSSVMMPLTPASHRLFATEGLLIVHTCTRQF